MKHTILIATAFFSISINAAGLQKQKFLFKKEYNDAKIKIEKTEKLMPELGFLWRSEGILYAFNYKFQDGEIKENLPKAEKCFITAIRKKDVGSYYLLAYVLNKEGKTEEALSILENQLNKISNLKVKSSYVKKDFLDMANLYSGIILDKKMPILFVEKAIDFSFSLAYYDKNPLAELQVGLLYRRLGKIKQAKYFVGEACINNPTKEVDEKCRKLVTVVKKHCEECRIKKSLNL